ncbi:MAG: dTDP-4-dehydrorhamnose reductase [Pseudomonadota bacterium]
MVLKICLFGRTGQVSTEIQRLAGPEIVVRALGRDFADLAEPEACAAAVHTTDADVIINAAAYTSVDKAEEEEALATRINADAPRAMATAAAARGLPFLHISSDYVFDGATAQPLDENAPALPLSAYGRSKLLGEQAVTATAGHHAVLRTSWVFSPHGSNFIKTILRYGAERKELKVVNDQIGGPTAARNIAATLITMAKAYADGRGVDGLFHYCGTPAVTWYGLAREVFRRHSDEGPEIYPIDTADWPAKATRPANVVLNCDKIRDAYGISQPDWRVELGNVLDELQSLGTASKTPSAS